MTSRKNFWLGGIVAVAVVLIIAVAYAGLLGRGMQKSISDDKPIPVKIALAERRDAPNFLSGIATVQALNTVLVRARVDGEISRVLFKEGEHVKRGDILVELDRRPFEVQLRAMQAQREKDGAQLSNTKRDLERYEFLVKNDSLATQTLDTARAQFEQLRASLDADQAQIDMARLQLNYATIRSPIDGRLGARLIDAGNLVHANDTNGLVVVSQIHPVFVTFALPQQSLPALRRQQEHKPLRVIALNQDANEMLDEGELTLIESQIDAATGTIHCKAIFKNEHEKLWPGAFVAVQVVLGDLPNAVTVPTAAIQPGAQHSFVYVVAPNNTVQSRQVEIGPVSGTGTVILKGLSDGERVVVEGQFQLEDGARVDIKNAKTLPASSKSPVSAANGNPV